MKGKIVMNKKKTFLKLFSGVVFFIAGFVLFVILIMILPQESSDAIPDSALGLYFIFLILGSIIITITSIVKVIKSKKQSKKQSKEETPVNAFNSMPETARSIPVNSDNGNADAAKPAAGGSSQSFEPVKLEGGNIHINSFEFVNWIRANSSRQFEHRGIIPLIQKTPVISLFEDGVRTRNYCLQTEEDEDFTGKYFHISVRLNVQGNPVVPVAQIDGFVSDTPEDRNMAPNDVGYRMEVHFLACGGDVGEMRYEINRGEDLVAKALKYPGYTTPSNVRLIGICPDCKKSFVFHSYAYYLAQTDVAYSDDGLDCCKIESPDIDKETWEYETEGKTFRYYNSFNCPHCGSPYINYNKYRQNKVFGVSGCVHIGRKVYSAE